MVPKYRSWCVAAGNGTSSAAAATTYLPSTSDSSPTRHLLQVRRATQWELSDEIDPQANFVVHGRIHVFSPVSLGLLDETSRLRQFLVWLITWAWWDRIILVVILLNTLALAATDYSLAAVDPATMEPDGRRSATNALIDATEPIFTAIFTAECVCKVLAMGFVSSRGAYLRDGWNCLDFVVVLTSILKVVPGVPRMSALRAFRVLRPLRTLSRIKGMRLMVKSLLASLPSLLNVGILLGFAFAIYGILGLNLFMGLTHARCRLVAGPVAIPASHLQPWTADSGAVQPSTLPWVIAGEYAGLLPSVSNGRLLNGTDLPSGQRQPLYFEMMDRYYSGNAPGNVIYEQRTLGEELEAAPADLPWTLPDLNYVSYAAAANYVWQITYNRSAFPSCGAGQLVDPGAGPSGARWPDSGMPVDDPAWTQSTSPWSTPQMCVWPMDADNQRICSTGSSGYQCGLDPTLTTDLPRHIPAGSATANRTLQLRFTDRTCGSNYDVDGNHRFIDGAFMASEDSADALEDGVVNFDNLGSALLLLFQCLTQEGWTTIMYWYMDSYQPVVAAVVFVSFSLVGALFLLNLVVASIFLNFSTAQLTEQDSLRIRRERVAAIKAAEKAEQLRAVAKARLVAQVRHRALLTKVRLRRLSVAAERLALSPGALEAAAAADAMHAELDPEGEVPPALPFGVDASPGSSDNGTADDGHGVGLGPGATGAADPVETEADVFAGAQGPSQLHGVLRRRLAHTLSVRSMQARPVHLPSGVVVADDYVSTPSVATASATPSVAARAGAANATQGGTLSPARSGRGAVATGGGLSALGSGVAAVMRTLSFTGGGNSTRNLVHATAATGVSGGSTTAGAIGIIDSSRSNGGEPTTARAETVRTYHTATTAVHSPIAGESSEAPITPLPEDSAPLPIAPAIARPSLARGTSQRLGGVGVSGRGLGLMAPSGLRPRVPHLPPLGLGGGPTSPPHRAPSLVQPSQDASVGDAAVGRSSAINYGGKPGLTALRGVSTRLLGPQGVSRIAAAPAPASQLLQQGVSRGGTATAATAHSDDASVVSGQTGISDGFSGFFKRGGRGGGSGAASVAGSDALHTVTEGDDEGSVTSFSSMDTALAKSYTRRFAMPTRTPWGLRLRYYALEFATSGAFNLLMVLLIVLNMVTMSMDAYPVDVTLSHRLDVLNAVLTLVFALEMIVRIYALGLRAYARDRMNLFDVLVVFLSLIDLAISPPYLWTGMEAQSTSVLALRTLRLTRVFKLARSWTSLRVLIKTIFSAAKDVMYFGVLLLLYMFIFSLLGIQLFANRWRFDPSDGSLLTPQQPLYYDNNAIIPRSNYDNLWSAMLSTMQLLTFENWTVSLALPWRSHGFLDVAVLLARILTRLRSQC